jgi:flagellar biosynthesis/type III secretory pathway protein FliH
MPGTVTTKLDKPIAKVKILDNYAVDAKPTGDRTINSSADDEQISMQDSESPKTAFLQACQALNNLNTKLNEFYDKIFAEHKEEIAKLSIEIARKVLSQKVKDGDYEIESIIKEALKSAPTHQDMVVHLNPDDLKQCLKMQQEEPDSILSGIKLIPDSNVGRAECVLENPKGIIKSLIDLHLEKITQALKEAK